MNIYTVRDNLLKTIAGKEKLLAEYKDPSLFACHRLVKDAMVQFLEVNIDELKRILQDVETCCEKATEDSWALNPDRMGGQFTQDEIYNPDRQDWIEP